MARDAAGFTLVEVVLALFLIAITVMALAPLFVFASKENAAAGDQGTAGALAVQQMELLRSTPFEELANGGDLASDVAGYHDAASAESRVRWTIADGPGGSASAKVITVRALTVGPAIRGAREAQLVTVRSY